MLDIASSGLAPLTYRISLVVSKSSLLQAMDNTMDPAPTSFPSSNATALSKTQLAPVIKTKDLTIVIPF